MQCIFEHGQEPAQPGRDIECALLRGFELLVVFVTARHDRGTERVEANRRLFGLRQGAIGDRAGDTAIAVVERMQRDQPEVGDACSQDRIEPARRGVEPVDEALQFGLQAIARRGLEVNNGSIDAPGDHLHRLIPAQFADSDIAEQRWLGEQRGLPMAEFLDG